MNNENNFESVQPEKKPTGSRKSQELPEIVGHEAKLEKIEQAYSSTPWWYDVRGFLILTFAYRNTLTQQIRFFASNIGPVHLEGAIGTGTLFELVLKWRKLTRRPSSKIIGFDYAPRMLEGARARFKKEKQVDLQLADATALSFKDETFDTVNIANAIHCLPDIEKALKEVHRVLKHNGTFAGNTLIPPKGKGPLDWIAKKINQWGIKKGILYRPYEKQEIRRLLEDLDFEFVTEKVSGNCYQFVVKKK